MSKESYKRVSMDLAKIINYIHRDDLTEEEKEKNTEQTLD